MQRERLNLVVVGHVDHGKSTVIGRLLADTGSLPEGRLEQVKATCARNAKPFEYAFLLDALANEQSQGITIDTARCFFKSKTRDYIIIDAPGHIEFLKNMVTGAARAEAALLVIDAKEGVRENSRRHGYMLSMLGIRQVVVCVNKMDLVAYAESAYEAISAEYAAFLARIGVRPAAFIPISAINGENLIEPAASLGWYRGPALLDLIDGFANEKASDEKSFRFPVQDVYKFTEYGDDRRVVAGRVESGSIGVGEEVVFLPSNKRARIRSIEEFSHEPRTSVSAGLSTAFTVEPEVYVRPGEVMVRAGDPPPMVGTTFRANLFWMGRQPMVRGRKYKLKIATAEVPVWLRAVRSALDASELQAVEAKGQIDLYDVADCVLETFKPVAGDRIGDVAATGRFVIVDGFEIAGGGILIEQASEERSLVREHIRVRERGWERTPITAGIRSARYQQRSTFVVVAGEADVDARPLARRLEERLLERGRFVYYLGLSNALLGVQADVGEDRSEFIRRLGEVAHLFTDAGTILIATVPDADDDELSILRELNRPNDMLVVSLGEGQLDGSPVDLRLAEGIEPESGAREIESLLMRNNVFVEYAI